MDTEFSLDNFPSEFTYDIDSKDSNGKKCILIRANLQNKEDCERWLKAYESKTRTKWIVAKVITTPFRSVFHKTWMCHLSNRNKSKDSQRSTDCKAKIDIKVKKLNRNTKRKDKYLRRDPPLSAVIHLELKHNHHVQCDTVLKYLRISQEVTEEFECYFRDGLTPIEACEVHEMKIKLHKNADINLADGSINPSLRKVYHLYHKWRRVTAAGAQPINTNSHEDYIHRVPVILDDNLPNESHKPYGPPTSVTRLQPLHKQTNTGTYTALTVEAH